MKHLLGLLVAASLGCSKTQPVADAAPPPPSAPTATVKATTNDDGRTIAKNACLSCHSEEMLAQQRLTPAQWAKVVTKMTGWGANLEPKDTETLTGWLAATYGPDAGPYVIETIAADVAEQQLATSPDGVFANGDAERGRALYTDRCSGCHGSEARGHIGVLLVDRPLLYRASELAETIRKGRGKMAPIAMTDPEVADVLAHLRRLTNR